MPWQDIVISFGTLVFFIALIPSIRSKDKPALSTSLITGTFLAIFAITFATLGLWLTMLSNILTSAAWFTLGIQKYMKTRK